MIPFRAKTSSLRNIYKDKARELYWNSRPAYFDLCTFDE